DRALTHGYDVIALDRDLPGMHGDQVYAELVAAGCRSRVLMLTAAAANEDLVDGLGLGADDYLPKPFDFPVLAARIGALARRAHPGRAPRGGAPGPAGRPPPPGRCPATRPGSATPRGAARGGRARRWSCRRRSSASWSCWPPRTAGPSPPKNCWNGCGMSSPTR